MARGPPVDCFHRFHASILIGINELSILIVHWSELPLCGPLACVVGFNHNVPLPGRHTVIIKNKNNDFKR